MFLVLKDLHDESRLGFCIRNAFVADCVDKSAVVNTVSCGLGDRYENKCAFVYESVEFLASRCNIQVGFSALLYLSFPQIQCRVTGNDGDFELE